MKYTKPALSYEDQLTLLAGRGLQYLDRERALRWLQRIGYYRLSAYFIPFRIPATDDFRPGTTLAQIIDLYKFDCGLRLLVLEAMDRIEVTVRALITYRMAHDLGVFGYADPTNFSAFYNHAELMEAIRIEEGRTPELFVAHYRRKYVSEPYLPIWMATELISFGALSKMFSHAKGSLRKKISRDIGQADPVFVSWIHALATIRNTCAHHGRLWNRELAVKPKMPTAWWTDGISNRRFYVLALIIQTLLARAWPGSSWKQHLKDHFDAHPAVDITHMHFPVNWQQLDPWK